MAEEHPSNASGSRRWHPVHWLAARCAERLYHLQPLDADEQPAVARIIEDATTWLNLPTVQLYQLLGNKSQIVVPVGTVAPNKLFLNLELLNRLTTEEQEAVIIHELTHLAQPMATVAVGKLLAAAAHAAKSACDTQGILQDGRIIQWLDRLVERGIYKVAAAEQEADANGAAVTSVDTMKRAILKMLLFSMEAQGGGIQCNFDQPTDTIARQLDACFSDTQADRIITGGSLCERFAALDAAARGMRN